MVILADLKPADGATHKTKRKGRGRSSGHGKTSCRGHNGEGQRAGCSAKRGFEGGQMPGYRQMPKLKGFKCPSALVAAELNVGRIDALKMKEITLAALKEAGRAHPSAEVLRILGNGEIKTAVTITANHVSPSAKTKIEAAGGTVNLIEKAAKVTKKVKKEA